MTLLQVSQNWDKYIFLIDTTSVTLDTTRFKTCSYDNKQNILYMTDENNVTTVSLKENNELNIIIKRHKGVV